MINGYERARYNYIWISDSNVAISSSALQSMMDHLADPSVGLVHQVPRGISAETFGGLLEDTYFLTTHLRMYLIANALGINCVMGKSMLFRKSDLEKVGGMRFFANYLAEDYFIGDTIKKMGLKHAIAEEPVNLAIGQVAIEDFAMRRIRWTRLRKNMVPLTTVFEPISESVTCGLMGALAVWALWGASFWCCFLIHMGIWFFCDLVLAHQLYAGSLLKHLWSFSLSWVARELSYFPIFAYSVCGNSVCWRGQLFYLKPGGLVEAATKPRFHHEDVSTLKASHIAAILSSALVIFRIAKEIVSRAYLASDFENTEFVPELPRGRSLSFSRTLAVLQMGVAMHLQNENNMRDILGRKQQAHP